MRSIRAYLYYQETGKVGDQELTTGKLALWNSMVGEGDAGAPSGAVLVLVDITGPRFRLDTSGAIELTVRAGAKELLRESVALSHFDSRSNEISVPFFAYGTGCEPLDLAARLRGPGSGQGGVETARVEFKCGE